MQIGSLFLHHHSEKFRHVQDALRVLGWNRIGDRISGHERVSPVLWCGAIEARLTQAYPIRLPWNSRGTNRSLEEPSPTREALPIDILPNAGQAYRRCSRNLNRG